MESWEHFGRVGIVVCCLGVFGSVGREQSDAAAIDRLISQMTLDEKVAMLHGATDPERYGQAGYLPGVPRLGIPPLRLTDGPAGVRTSLPATALPAPVALAATFSPELAAEYGGVLAADARARHQDVVLAPMVNIVRVPQGGRNFETLGEDPLLASILVASEVHGMTSAGVIATVKHFALNNQENQRQSVSADVDERTMREIELPAFEAAVKAGAVVMAAYNKVNGTWSAEHPLLLTDILRNEWGFTGFVMSDWGATHSGVPALLAGLDLEMPGGSHFGTLAEAVRSGQLAETTIDQAVRRILTVMNQAKLLEPQRPAWQVADVPQVSSQAREIAIAGAVLLKNEQHLLPLGAEDSVALIGPTARSLLIGGGGSARVLPMHTGSVLETLRARMPTATFTHADGYDVDGVTVPASALALRRTSAAGGDATVDATIDFTGSHTLPAGSSWNWAGTITAPASGDYQLAIQTAGGRGTVSVDPVNPPVGATPPGGPGRGGGRGRGGGPTASLLPTADGLANAVLPVHFEAGVPRTLSVSATAGAATRLQVRLAWRTPTSSTEAIAQAVRLAKAAKTAVVFVFDESQEGRDRASLSLPGDQDALVAAVAAANPRTVVVLNTGAPVLMPWVDAVRAILQTWYPGQEGADATAALLRGDVAPGGKLPVTFPRRLEDVPTNVPERYPGVDGHAQYSEGLLVGYRWYDNEKIAPLFPFGHGLSYTEFDYSSLTVVPRQNGQGYDVTFTIKNIGTRAGTDVPQVYVGRPAAPPVPMADHALAGFERVTLGPGQSLRVTIPITERALAYWSVTDRRWVTPPVVRTVMVGASSRDIRLRAEVRVH